VRVVTPEERQGVSRARNLGARESHGRIVVFSDAHVTVPDGWFTPIEATLSRPEVGAIGPVVSSWHEPEKKGYGFRWRDASFAVSWLPSAGTDPYAVPFLAGGFSAMRRDVFDAVDGFDGGMILWGMEDAELSLRLWLLGYECLLVPAVDILHFFRAKHPYQVGWLPVLHNQLRTALLHLGTARLEKVAGQLVGKQAFPEALARVAESDVWQRRDHLRAQRRYDDDWFFERFGMDW
jgi:GT2 family glycosyltransferase